VNLRARNLRLALALGVAAVALWAAYVLLQLAVRGT
jgi:hypothetical protein